MRQGSSIVRVTLLDHLNHTLKRRTGRQKIWIEQIQR